jgi:hypothetical protein
VGQVKWRQLVFLLVGLSTPVGVLAVNGSAFIMRHLPEFRLTIAACALVSGLSLTGLSAWGLLNKARMRAPRLYAEYSRWIVGVVAVVVVVWSAFGAWGTYWSMNDPRRLPNLAAVLFAFFLLLLPFAMAFVARRANMLPGDRPASEAPTKRRLARIRTRSE